MVSKLNFSNCHANLIFRSFLVFEFSFSSTNRFVNIYNHFIQLLSSKTKQNRNEQQQERDISEPDFSLHSSSPIEANGNTFHNDHQREMGERPYDQSRYRNHERSEDIKKSLYCGNLPFDITDEKLEQQFSQFGTVVSCKIPLNPATKEPRGFGFIVLAEESQAEAAINHFSNSPDMIVQYVILFYHFYSHKNKNQLTFFKIVS